MQHRHRMQKQSMLLGRQTARCRRNHALHIIHTLARYVSIAAVQMKTSSAVEAIRTSVAVQYQPTELHRLRKTLKPAKSFDPVGCGGRVSVNYAPLGRFRRQQES